MNRKLLTGTIGTLVVLGIAVLIFRPMAIGSIIVLILLVAMLSMVNTIRKKKASLFHDQMDPKIAARRYKRLKAFLLVAGISFVVIIIGTIGHNVIYGLTEVEESTFLTIALVGGFVFIMATASALFIFLRGRRKTG